MLGEPDGRGGETSPCSSSGILARGRSTSAVVTCRYVTDLRLRLLLTLIRDDLPYTYVSLALFELLGSTFIRIALMEVCCISSNIHCRLVGVS